MPQAQPPARHAPTVLSIQSWVCFGHVGNAGAVFPLQRLGAEVWAINTVQFSNHTGYGHWTGQVFEPGAITALLDGIEARGVLGGCDAVLSGYLGAPGIGEAVLDAAGRVRAANPAMLYCCDPVIGDDGRGVFVRPGIAELLGQRAVPAADILTPNRFELEQLTALPCGTLSQAKHAAGCLRARMHPAGPQAVLVTSLRGQDTPADALDMLAVAAEGSFRLRVPLLSLSPNGAGDVVAALFLFHLLAGRGVRAALERAASSTAGLLRRTLALGAPELAVVAAQDEFVSPSRLLSAEPC